MSSLILRPTISERLNPPAMPIKSSARSRESSRLRPWRLGLATSRPAAAASGLAWRSAIARARLIPRNVSRTISEPHGPQLQRVMSLRVGRDATDDGGDAERLRVRGEEGDYERRLVRQHSTRRQNARSGGRLGGCCRMATSSGDGVECTGHAGFAQSQCYLAPVGFRPALPAPICDVARRRICES
jgi:hypothetical protein